MKINDRLEIPDHELEFQFARSSGPGGQNVNKVSSKAILNWDVTNSEALPPAVKERFMARYQNKISKEGLVVIASDEYRDQKRNMASCEEKLAEMVLAVATPPKKRKPTKPTRAAKEQRLTAKKARGDVKKSRGKVEY